MSIAQKLGYVSIVETLKIVTETTITTTTTTTTEEKYKVITPEAMQETLMSDSEDEGGEFFRNLSSDLHALIFCFFHIHSSFFLPMSFKIILISFLVL